MTASLTLKSAIEKSLQTLAFLPLVISLVYPKIGLAQTTGQSSLVFTIEQTQKEEITKPKLLQYDEIVQNDPLVIKLTNYLQKHNSPLAEYADDIILQPQWKRALAISWVESNFGIHCAYNNCSGIGGNPKMKSFHKYDSKLEWFVDMNQLLEKPVYKEKVTTFKDMCGYYVQPCSSNWFNGSTKKYAELEALEKEAMLQGSFINITADNITLASSK